MKKNQQILDDFLTSKNLTVEDFYSISFTNFDISLIGYKDVLNSKIKEGWKEVIGGQIIHTQHNGTKILIFKS